jgi:hypothetical protein
LNLKKKKTGAITCDAYHMTDPRADGLGVSTCIELALKDARIEKEQVNYINAHATSTLVGDVAEVKAVRKVFTDTKGIAMNGTKSMIGHCLGAAGGMEAVATIQAIRTGWVRILLHFFSYIFLASKKKKLPKKTPQYSTFFLLLFHLLLFLPPFTLSLLKKKLAGPPHDQPREPDRRGRRHRYGPQRQEGAQGHGRNLQLVRLRGSQLGRRIRAVRGLEGSWLLLLVLRGAGCFILRERRRGRKRETEREGERGNE